MAKVTILTKKRALAELERVVREAGEGYIYPKNGRGGCSYVPDSRDDLLEGAERCAVGRVLTNLGVPDKTLIRLVGIVPDIKDQLPFKVQSAAERALTAFQYNQDNGVPWGKCLKIAQELSSVLLNSAASLKW